MHRSAGDARARMIQAAADLIHVHGVSGTSVDAVLRMSATGKGQFYHYFNDKNHLVREVLAFQLARNLDLQRQFLDRLSSWEAIREWLNVLVDQHQERDLRGGCPIGSIAAEMADRDETLRKLLAAAFREWESHLADGLSAMKDQGLLLGHAVPSELAEATMASIQGGYLLATTKRDASSMRNALEAAYSYLQSFKSDRHA